MENEEKFDYYQILHNLTEDKTQVSNFEDKLQQILDKTLPLLSEEDKCAIFGENNSTSDNVDIRYQYVKIITYVLQKIQVFDTSNYDDCISVHKYRTFKVAIELLVSIGIIQCLCLLPGVGTDVKQLCPRASQLGEEKTSILQKYERLCLTTRSLIEYYNGTLLRPAVLSQLGPLIAALLQLSHAPLMKACEDYGILKQGRTKEPEFVMTPDLYTKLQSDRAEFLSTLRTVLDNYPQYMVIKKLMLILGFKRGSMWLRRQSRKYLVEKIQQPHGVMSLIGSMCNDTLDFGTDWDKLDILARLIATSHEIDRNKYYEAICPQLLNLLTTKKINHASIIANSCIAALYESSPDVCEKNILHVIMKPLLTNFDHKEEVEVMVQEHELNTCIENLWTCFNVTEAQSVTLPCNLMSVVAIPLFCIHVKVKSSVFRLKNKVRELLLKLLHDETLRDDLFAAYLGYDTSCNFGKYISTKFGSNGGLEVVGIEKNLPYEELADNLFDLVSPDKELIISLFSCIMKLLSNFMKSSHINTLEAPLDTMERIEKQLASIKLLSHLANKSSVQEAQLKNPGPLLNFIKTLFVEHTSKNHDDNENDDYEIVYISLMLIKMILSSDSKMLDQTSFESFAKFLKEQSKNSTLTSQLVQLMEETVSLIESKHQQSNNKHCEDLFTDCRKTSKFEEAIRDLSDPLLPVRAHGLITLTKLIEAKDPLTVSRKSILLRLFQENLKHEDSFIYLAAINGMCALAVTYPTTIIETLVQEYIDMPQRIARAELTSEIRVKLGEILVNTTRGLGGMVVTQKNILINGFLCATRDPDPLVRASSLSCLGELCKVLGFQLGDVVIEVLYCINCIIETDKVPECRRAAILVITLLLRGLGKHVLTNFSRDLVVLYRSLRHLRNNDKDPILRLHAQLALEEIDEVVQTFLFVTPKLEKTIFLLEPSM